MIAQTCVDFGSLTRIVGLVFTYPSLIVTGLRAVHGVPVNQIVNTLAQFRRPHQMPTVDDLDAVLVESAKLSGFLEVLRDDDKPRWWLTVDEEHLLMVESDPDSGELMMTAEILVLSDVPDESHPNVLKQALSYNTLWQETGGGRIALLPEDQSLQLMLSVPEDQQEAAAICRIAMNLLQSADDWATAFTNAPADQAPPESGDSENLMRV